MKPLSAWLFIAATILFTVYGQIILKWQMSKVDTTLVSSGLYGKVVFFGGMLLKPWVISAYLAAFLASAAWMMAILRLPLSTAYPFMALNFVLVILAGYLWFGEQLRPGQMLGAALIVLGVALMGRGASEIT